MDNKQRLIDLVRKLLTLASDKAATPAEAAAAADKAAELIERHAINAEMLRKVGQVSEQDIEKNLYYTASAAWRVHLLQAVAQTTFCSLVRGQGQTMFIIGERQHFEVATFLYEYLVREIDRLADLGWELSPSSRSSWITARSWKASFRAGAAATVARRLYERRKERAESATASDSIALVVTNNRLASKVAEFFPRLRHTQMRTTTRSGTALAAGKLAGERIQIRDAMGTGSEAPQGAALRGA